MPCSTSVQMKVLLILVSGMCACFLGCDQSGTGSTTGSSKLTKENVLRITEGMSIDDAKLILGPPTNDVSDLGYLEWGDLGKPGPYVNLEFDKDSLKITRKKVIGLD
jgi:hypothetical protein